MKLTRIRELIKKCFQPRYLYRDSVSGEFVSSQYAQEHPHTTTRQRILFPRGGASQVIPGHIIVSGGLIVTAGLAVLIFTPPEARALEWAGKVGDVVIILGLIVAGLGIAWGLA